MNGLHQVTMAPSVDERMSSWDVYVYFFFGAVVFLAVSFTSSA